MGGRCSSTKSDRGIFAASELAVPDVDGEALPDEDEEAAPEAVGWSDALGARDCDPVGAGVS
jgi:hypothetical protein